LDASRGTVETKELFLCRRARGYYPYGSHENGLASRANSSAKQRRKQPYWSP